MYPSLGSAKLHLDFSFMPWDTSQNLISLQPVNCAEFTKICSMRRVGIHAERWDSDS